MSSPTRSSPRRKAAVAAAEAIGSPPPRIHSPTKGIMKRDRSPSPKEAHRKVRVKFAVQDDLLNRVPELLPPIDARPPLSSRIRTSATVNPPRITSDDDVLDGSPVTARHPHLASPQLPSSPYKQPLSSPHLSPVEASLRYLPPQEPEMSIPQDDGPETFLRSPSTSRLSVSPQATQSRSTESLRSPLRSPLKSSPGSQRVPRLHSSPPKSPRVPRSPRARRTPVQTRQETLGSWISRVCPLTSSMRSPPAFDLNDMPEFESAADAIESHVYMKHLRLLYDLGLEAWNRIEDATSTTVMIDQWSDPGILKQMLSAQLGRAEIDGQRECLALARDYAEQLASEYTIRMQKRDQDSLRREHERLVIDRDRMLDRLRASEEFVGEVRLLVGSVEAMETRLDAKKSHLAAVQSQLTALVDSNEECLQRLHAAAYSTVRPPPPDTTTHAVSEVVRRVHEACDKFHIDKLEIDGSIPEVVLSMRFFSLRLNTSTGHQTFHQRHHTPVLDFYYSLLGAEFRVQDNLKMWDWALTLNSQLQSLELAGSGYNYDVDSSELRFRVRLSWGNLEITATNQTGLVAIKARPNQGKANPFEGKSQINVALLSSAMNS